ncbi:thioredoxin-dependent thiol peroxidase [Kocuria sp.]|jgi:peroxiredoxin Q/BCP|uniref:thioredoxin-dependent thiol peroxidase n=1 Tax=Kocuria sp. TaxID=1871328 RepID=UPI002811FB81|nr:thioredoxin-dependent thiol peroxidase [Kocuria sp.]HST73179.1 thioredoxin-dependent thiol peroxidase [Kocuria rosea]
MAARLEPGQQAPDFTLPDASGRPVSLAEHRGRRTVVYFYPKAATPGCTTQACDFRDSLDRFTAEGFAVLGISPDGPEALARFARDQSLTFPLLSDPDHEVAEAYGAWGEKKNYGRTYEGLVRSTVVVGADGTVELAQYNVKASGHVAKLRRDLGLTA